VREKVLRYIRERQLMDAGDRVCVAVSGGADSVALLQVLLELRGALGIVLAVAHFNHGLRGEASEADEAFVAELARQYDLEFFSGRGDVRDHALGCKSSLEAAARELRYRWLTSLAASHKLNAIATGHTLDDQAETVLLKFLRGAGTRGLAGIYPEISSRAKEATEGRQGSVSSAEADSSLKASGWDAGPSTGSGQALKARTTRTALVPATSEAPNRSQSAEGGAEAPLCQDNASRPPGARIIRPLLGLTREEIEQYLTALGQDWREDESNLDHRFTRNRVRHELLPLLEREYNPNLRQVLSDTAELSRAEEEYWQGQVDGELEKRLHPQPRGRKTEVPQGLKPEIPVVCDGTAEGVPLQSGVAEQCPGAPEQRLSLVNFHALPLALQRRLLKRLLESRQIPPDFKHIEKLLHCALGESPKAELPGGWMALRQGGCLELRAPRAEGPFSGYQYTLPVPGEVHIAEIGLTVRSVLVPQAIASEAGPFDNLLSAELLGPALTVRNWHPGDRFHPLHSSAEEKLKRLFAEQHIPAGQRSSWPLVLWDSQVVWVRGFPVARAFAWKGSGDALKIELA
jgi:tRNA(Ile)-lysidine synthase